MNKHTSTGEPYTLAQLKLFLENNTETDDDMRSMFKFVSVVAFLRRTLPGKAGDYLADDICLHETDLWNKMAGPVFRCENLVNTCCADEADDRVFVSRSQSWPGGVPEHTPLLVQAIDTDVTYSARLHRYSGNQSEVKGSCGKCCVPGCTNEFTDEHPKGKTCANNGRIWRSMDEPTGLLTCRERKGTSTSGFR